MADHWKIKGLSASRVLLFAALVFFFALAVSICHAQNTPVPQRGAQAEIPAQKVNLADIIPLSTGLAGRLARLENDLHTLSDLSIVENQLETFKTFADDSSNRLAHIKGSNDRNRAKLKSLYQDLQGEIELSTEFGEPLSRTINLLAARKAEWQAEKTRWQQWATSVHTDEELPHLTGAFIKANETIDQALTSINHKLDAALKVQLAVGEVDARLDNLEVEIKALVSAYRRESLLSLSPPMFSPDYFAQFGSHLWQSLLINMQVLSWPSRKYFVQHSWSLSAQLLLFIAFILFISSNKQSLRESESWKFLAARPFSSALFVVVLTTLLFADYYHFPTVLKLVYTVIGGISFAFIVAYLREKSLKRRAALSVIVLFVVFVFVRNIGTPAPLYRLFIVIASLVILYFFSRWIRESKKQGDTPLFAWLLRLACVMSGVIVFAQLWGKVGLADLLFESSLTSLAIILAFMFFIYMTRGGLHWVFFSSPVWNFKLLRSEAELLSRRSAYLVEALIVLFVMLPMILTTWGISGSVQEARTSFFNLGFDIGSLRISVGLIFSAIGTLYGSFLLSWILPKVLLDDKVAGSGLERGTRISVSRLIQYFIIFVGFLLALFVFGFDLTKLTIILSALGVGIGFGLQGIVNNFFSGLVLLFEQPVRVGDSIEVDGTWAEIKRIGLRSTTVQTVEKADVIIPNGNLISRDLINWTLGNRQIRLSVPVGVAYDSDIPMVKEILLACAKENEFVVKSPMPQVLFMGFGENSLDFELRVWIADADHRLTVTSDLNQEIKRRFSETELEIPYPQRDLHLRSIDGSIVMPSPRAGEKD